MAAGFAGHNLPHGPAAPLRNGPAPSPMSCQISNHILYLPRRARTSDREKETYRGEGGGQVRCQTNFQHIFLYILTFHYDYGNDFGLVLSQLFSTPHPPAHPHHPSHRTAGEGWMGGEHTTTLRTQGTPRTPPNPRPGRPRAPGPRHLVNKIPESRFRTRPVAFCGHAGTNLGRAAGRDLN